MLFITSERYKMHGFHKIFSKITFLKKKKRDEFMRCLEEILLF